MKRVHWNDSNPPEGDGLAALVHRSRLLGVDRSIVNIFGGNTSVKSLERDHLGREVPVLWVKGSGSDLASIAGRDMAGLRLDEIEPLFNRTEMSDEEMTAYLERTVFEPGRPRQSIETLLHAFTPGKHVDHTHPDAIIAIACSPRGPELMREIYGDRAAWVPYVRPGFSLSRMIGAAVRENPGLECVVMGKHGLVTWGEDARTCYENTLRIIGEAEAWLNARATAHPFGETVTPPLPEAERRRLLALLLPVLRGAMSSNRKTILLADDDDDVLAFTGSADCRGLAMRGASCPDHLVHTKRLPLLLGWKPGDGDTALVEAARKGLAEFGAQYRRYFEAHAKPGDAMVSPQPRVILIPGIGMVTSGADAAGADVSRQLYHRAIAVMRHAASVGGFETLSEAESFAIEYWPLELYKLSRKPPPKPLDGHVALITGAASGIGRAAAARLAGEGAHVVIADRNEAGAREVAEELVRRHGWHRAVAAAVDVTQEVAVDAAFADTVLVYGGVDIVVNNAGISMSAPIEETKLADWQRQFDILSTGYFLIARAAFRILRAQGSGGSLVFVASKNAVVAGRNAAAYSAAKAAELHLARCLAEEGGAAGIRVNTVLPDAVLAGSSIWNSAWRADRAATYGIREDELEAHYRARTTLKVNITPEDVAEAILFFASAASSKTTGGALTVDGGVPAAYVR
ncbi:MAG TPA: bifunctional aldolase/short-chain dehydrogenase [Acetobacteraceae bacterium]|nr:bifunctional aldolase/short-chain dehydrogenase [Acetobacteraceae bacterium]